VSWDATLIDDRGHCEGDWNYTHNCNGMIAAAYEAVTGERTEQCGGPLGPAIGPAWWDRLDGASGKDGRDYLAAIIKGLEADPGRFRAMNPANGWGDYDSLLGVLREMRDRVPDWPTRWEASG
jgi:hypothetical protein